MEMEFRRLPLVPIGLPPSPISNLKFGFIPESRCLALASGKLEFGPAALRSQLLGTVLSCRTAGT
eukprot:11508182-Alexandrium_andersonii.AAC.1